jgi:hypothetical protein
MSAAGHQDESTKMSSELLESVPGMELMTRSSLHSMRNPSQVSIFLRETLTQEVDERNWSWTYLRVRFFI